MADVLLFAGSVGGTAFLSRHISRDLSRKQRSALTLALGVSLGLFSLSILDAIPSRLLLVLESDSTLSDRLFSTNYLSIATVYRFLLWILCIWIVFLLPAICGAQLLRNFWTTTKSDGDMQKSRARLGKRRCNKWIRVTTRVILVVPLIMSRISLLICCRLRKKFMGRCSEPPVLVMTTADDSTSTTTSPRRINVAKWFRQHPHHIQSAIVGSVLGVTISVLFLRSVGRLVMESSGSSQDTVPTNSWLPTMVSWLSAVGLLLSSVLNGFGSVSLPHSCMAGFYLEPIRPDTIARAQVELERTRSALESARSEALMVSSPSASSASLEGMTRRRTQTTSTGTTVATGESAHRKQRDVEFLEMLVVEQQDEIVEMKHSQTAAALARTPMGKFLLWIGILFSIILLVRLYMAMVSIWNGMSAEWSAASSTARGDPITTGLLWLTGHNLVNEQDYNALSQCISLLLTAFLSASQVRTFLRTISAIQRRLYRLYRSCYCSKKTPATSSTSTTSSSIIDSDHADSFAYLLSAVLGCYFLSCVVLTKMNLPLAYRAEFSAAMGHTTFVIQSSVANTVYVSSAAASAIVLGLLFGIKRQNTKRHAIEHDNGGGVPLGTLDAC